MFAPSHPRSCAINDLWQRCPTWDPWASRWRHHISAELIGLLNLFTSPICTIFMGLLMVWGANLNGVTLQLYHARLWFSWRPASGLKDERRRSYDQLTLTDVSTPQSVLGRLVGKGLEKLGGCWGMLEVLQDTASLWQWFLIFFGYTLGVRIFFRTVKAWRGFRAATTSWIFVGEIIIRNQM